MGIFFANPEEAALQMPLGKEIEDDAISLMIEVLGDNAKRLSGTRRDTEEGTDAEVYGLPCDITVNFFGKDFTEELPETYDIEFATVHFGVRTASSHKGMNTFATPVLVIGIDAGDAHEFRSYRNRIMGSFKKSIKEIIDLGQEMYWNWVDEHEE